MKKKTASAPVQRIVIVVLALALLTAIAIPVYFRFNPPSELPDDAWFEEVYAYRTEHAADSENLNAIMTRLPLPRKLKSEAEPKLSSDGGNRLYFSYRVNGSSSDFMSAQANKTAFEQCAVLLFSLVGDLDRVTIDVTDGDEITSATYDRAWADHNMDENVWEDAVSAQKLRTFFVRMQDLNVMAYKSDKSRAASSAKE